MADYKDKIKELEDQISKTKYNKKTQAAIGKYKAQLAILKEKEVSRGSKGPRTDGYQVRKTGDGTVILLGYPSAGKSTLLNVITGAESEVGAYAFTTLTVIPGTLDYNHAKIQILDVPGIVAGAASGKGRGKEVLAAMRSADLALIILDATRPNEHKSIIKEAREAGIRLNQRLPDVKIKKTGKDGLKILKTLKLTKLDNQAIKNIFKEFKINNAEIVLREDIDMDELIDVLEANKKYMPAITVLNKKDLVTDEELAKLKKKLNADIEISAKNNEGIDDLKELIFEKLNLIRIFLKEPGKNPDLDVPLIHFKDSTIKGICDKLHKDFAKKFKFARVWGKSSKFPGQKLMLHHTLQDGDILEIHLR